MAAYEIQAGSRLFCVLGHPVKHSLSPAMQNVALRWLGIDGVYTAFDVAPADLAAAVRGLQALGAGGVNCTIPHKEALLELVDHLSEDARRLGAVNTLVFSGRGVEGHNTDAPGFLAALQDEEVTIQGERAVILGAGGSARSVAMALAGAGAAVTICNRTLERAKELAATVNEQFPGNQATALELESGNPALRRSIEDASLLVNTTSLGMSPQLEELPPISVEAFHRHLFVYDLIYNPRETRLLRNAREGGSRTANGVGMLAHQGALSLALWTGKAVPGELVERMKSEIQRKLPG